MKNSPFIVPPTAVRIGAALAAIVLGWSSGQAAELKAARVTQVVRDVKLLPGQQAPRPATVNATVTNGTAVRTGVESRSELTFNDQTITRLGANTIFSFTEGTRNMELKDGAMLLRVPKNAGGAKITSAAVTAAITGTTVLFEAHPIVKTTNGGNKAGYYKFICLEGTARVYDPSHLGESVLVKAGQMTIGKPGQPLANPVDVDIGKILKTSLLINGFKPLASASLMEDEVAKQDQQKANGQLYNTNLAIYGGGTNIALGDPTNNNAIQQATSAQSSSGPSTPGQFGPPTQIPGNYQVTSGTQITNGTQIMTNGVTNYGTIYRNFAQDGLRSLFFFGTTRPFDTASGFNLPTQTMFNLNNMTVFKFESLQLAGNPTISIPNGAPTRLALIGVNGITSNAPGGTLTFLGLDTLLLTTQSGDIVLGNSVSFQNIQNLVFYARGTNAALTIGSPITGTNLLLNSEGTVEVDGNVAVTNITSYSQGDFLAGTGVVTATNLSATSTNGNITIVTDNFHNPNEGGTPTGAINLAAANTLTFVQGNGNGEGGFDWASLTAVAQTINFTSTGAGHELNFTSASTISFTAGTGGFNGPNLDIYGPAFSILSIGDISVNSAVSYDPDLEENVYEGQIRTTGGSINATGDLISGLIDAHGNITSSNGSIMGSQILAGGNISAGGSLEIHPNSENQFGNITAGGDISADGGIFTPGDPVVVSAGGSISAPGVITGTLTAGTDITIDNTAGTFGFGIIANQINVGGTLYLINSPSITPNNGSASGNDGETFNDFMMTVGSIVSTGPTYAVLSSNGGDANPSFADSNPGNGGHITLTITGGGLSIGDGNDLGAIQAKGGAYNPAGPFGGGNGGTIDLIVAGNVLIENRAGDHAGINASTGTVSDVASQYAGNGGTVNVTAGGQISVNGNIKVSSDDATQTDSSGPGRESASGGTIDLQSSLTTGSGIMITSNGGLLSFLNPNAPGPGGTITLTTAGADITVNGTIEADLGTIAIDQTDPVGPTPLITIDGATLTSETLSITGAGDVNIGLINPVTINAVTLSLSAAKNLNWSGGTLSATATNSDGNVSISAGQAINITNDLDIERTNNGRTSGLNVTLNAGTDLSVGGNLSLTTDASNIETGGNILVTSGGDMTIGGAFTLSISTASGTTGVGGNINVTSGGSLTAGSLDFGLNFDASTQVTNGENLTLTVTNNLITTAGGVSLALSTPVGPDRPPLINGGNVSMTIGGDLMLASGGDLNMEVINNETDQVNTGGNVSASVDGNLSANQINALITNYDSGIIGTGGNLTFSVGGNMTASSVALDIDNSYNGAITTGGNLNFNVGGDANLGSGGNLALSIENSNGGVISAGGDITASIGGSITASTVSLSIENYSSGMIGSDATITVNAADISPGDAFNGHIENYSAGSIMGQASITLGLSGNLTSQGDTDIYIENYSSGMIGSDAIITVNAGSISSGSLGQYIENYSSGMIGGNAALRLTLSGELISPGDTNFYIENYSSGTIIKDATIMVNAGSISTGGFLTQYIENYSGGTIGGNATLGLTLSGALMSQGDGNFYIDNSYAGTISGNATITLTAADVSTIGDFSQSISNNLGGMISGNAAVSLTLTGDLTTQTDANFTIDNSGGGTIGKDATIAVSAANVSTTGGFSAAINNYGYSTENAFAADQINEVSTNGGTMNGAAISLTLSGNLTTNASAVAYATSDATFTIDNNNYGTIWQDATITVGAANVSAAGNVVQSITNHYYGTIFGQAAISLTLSGNLTTTASANPYAASNATFMIDNGTYGGIGKDATIAVNGANVSTAGNFAQSVSNYYYGSVGGNAALALTLSGDLTTNANENAGAGGDATFEIDNSSDGTISKDATITVSAANISTAGEFIESINSNYNGTIFGNASIALTLSGTGSLTTEGGAGLFIDNSNGGTISGNATIGVLAANISIGGDLNAYVDNTEGSILGNANINFNLSGDLTTGGNASFSILNSGGTIGGDSSISVNAVNITIDGSLSATTDGSILVNASENINVGEALSLSSELGHSITSGGNLTLSAGGNMVAPDLAVNLSVDPQVNIGTGANITVTTGGDLSVSNADGMSGLGIYTNSGGMINTGGNVMLEVGGNLTTTNFFATYIYNFTHIGVGGNVVVAIGGNLASGYGFFGPWVQNADGVIDSGGNATLTVMGDATADSLSPFINNGGGSIGTGGDITVHVGGNVNGSFSPQIVNTDGQIGNGGNILCTVGGNLTGDSADYYGIDLSIYNHGGTILSGGNITLNVSGSMNSSTYADFIIDNSGGGSIGSNPSIMVSAASISIGNNLNAYVDNTGGMIAGSTAVVQAASIQATGDISVGGALNVLGNVTAGSATHTGTISADTISSTNVTALNQTNGSGSEIDAGAGGIRQFTYNDGNGVPAVMHTLTADKITSVGGVIFDGASSDGTSPAANAGSLTMNVNSLQIGGTGADIVGPVSFNGGDGNGSFAAGNGGVFIVNAVNDLTINTDIEASTGNVGSTSPSGNGGSVSLNSANGTVTVASRVQVSHAGPTPGRSSNRGGNITLTSGKKSGVAINITNTAQLLALLSAAAPPGNGGTVTITAGNPAQGANNSGNNSAININGTLVATNGTISVSHYGDSGSININGGQIGAQMSADVIKAQVYGANGSLNLGGGSILSAGSVLKLYASGANGTVNFIGNVTLTGNSMKTIWGDTVNIKDNVIVTIGGPNQANVYTNHANYTGWGGTPTTGNTGTFAGMGAVTHLGQTPPGGG